MSFIDRAPPKPQTDDYLKEELKSARNGVGGLLMIAFSVAGTAQLFSRWPGTAGRLLHASWLLGLALQCFFVQGWIELGDVIDLRPVCALFAAELVVWFLGVALLLIRAPLPTTREVEPGVGVFRRWLPLSANSADRCGDLAVAAALSGLFLWLDVPVLARWYSGMVFFLLLGHGWLSLRRHIRESRRRQTMHRARHWRLRARRRHYL